MGRKIIGAAGKVAGPKGSWRRRWTVLLSLALAVAMTMAIRQTVLAVHETGAFELEGNAVSDQVGNHDWDRVSNPAVFGPHGAVATSFAAEPSLAATIFTGGGSKDPININQWAWKDEAGGLPDKDNLLHSFAARYSLPPTLPTGSCPNGTGGAGQPAFNPNIPCELLFFGSDRYDNSGDAHQAFWFFQGEIALGKNKTGGGLSFSGLHENGDLLVVSNFSNGGTTSTIVVLKWDSGCQATNKPAGCADANLRLLASAEGAKCVDALPDNDQFCGIVNPTTTTLPWSFQNKTGTGGNQALNGEFYEGGVNLSLLGLAGECFASVMSETRSSTSTTATLKDFVLGNFAECDSSMVTTPKTGAGGAIPAGGLSIGTGTVSVADSAQLTISGAASWTGNLKFFLCGPGDLDQPGTSADDALQDTCAANGTQVGPVAGVTVTQATTMPVLSAAATVTSVGYYCWRGVFTSGTTGVPDAFDSSSGECFSVIPVTPGLTTTASANVEIGNAISDTANLTGTATQPGTPVIGSAGLAASGTITFSVYGPNDATCTGTVAFSSGPHAVSGNGNYQSNPFTPTAAGTYRWIAAYTGNSPNTNSKTGACNDANESVVVSPKQPTITTDATADPPTGASLGSNISDTATLSGATSTAGGSITFNLYGPDDATCSGTSKFTATINVSGNGPYNSGNFAPTVPGTYRWTASYSGDANNLTANSPCNAPGEASLIVSTTITTSQFFYPNDSVTITASGGGDLAGSVVFSVFTNVNCDAPALYTSPAINITTGTGTGLNKTVKTSNTTIEVNASGVTNLFWKVDYTSTNAAHPNASSACGKERSTININNNFTP